MGIPMAVGLLVIGWIALGCSAIVALAHHGPVGERSDWLFVLLVLIYFGAPLLVIGALLP